MAKKKKKQTPIERFLALTDEQKNAEVAQYEGGVDESKFRELTAAERKLWARTQRKLRAGRGRRKIGRGSKMIPVSIELGLLEEVNAFAKAHQIKRSQLVADGLRLVMQRRAS